MRTRADSNPMTTANCPGNEELDFRLIFGEDGQQPVGPSGQCGSLSPSVHAGCELKAQYVSHDLLGYCLYW